MEVTQFTYFQQVGGIACEVPSCELTYGLERLAMYIQGVENVYDLDFNGAGRDATATSSSAPRSNTAPTTSSTPTRRCCSATSRTPRRNAPRCCERGLALPAYDQCIKASHRFNLLDARGAISVTERAAYIGRVRALAKGCCEAWLAGEKAA